jgi:alpha-beta hydrolase superfamily lysophospholipase
MKHKEGKFTGFRNVNIFYQYWVPDKPPRAVLLLVHGLADHSSRFQTFVEYFVGRGYAIAALDLRGHGKSSGTPGYVDKFSDFVADLEIFFRHVRDDFKTSKIFMVGHSVGGTVSTSFAISHQSELAGLILSGPVLKPGASITRTQILMAKTLSMLVPRFGVAPLEAGGVCRRPEIVQSYIDDPLVYHGKISARLGAELINTLESGLPPKLREITLPILVMFGSEDRLSNPAGSQLLYDSVKSSDKTLQEYKDLYHEIFNEPEREQVYTDMEKWLSRQIQK